MNIKRLLFSITLFLALFGVSCSPAPVAIEETDTPTPLPSATPVTPTETPTPIEPTATLTPTDTPTPAPTPIPVSPITTYDPDLDMEFAGFEVDINGRSYAIVENLERFEITGLNGEEFRDHIELLDYHIAGEEDNIPIVVELIDYEIDQSAVAWPTYTINGDGGLPWYTLTHHLGPYGRTSCIGNGEDVCRIRVFVSEEFFNFVVEDIAYTRFPENAESNINTSYYLLVQRALWLEHRYPTIDQAAGTIGLGIRVDEWLGITTQEDLVDTLQVSVIRDLGIIPEDEYPFTYNFSEDYSYWMEMDEVSAVDGSYMYLSGGDWMFEEFEEKDAFWLDAPEPISFEGDGTIELTVDRVVEWGGLTLRAGNSGTLMLFMAGQPDGSELSVGFSKPWQDEWWDVIGKIENPSTPITLRLVFEDDTLRVYVNDELIGSDTSDHYRDIKSIMGFRVGINSEFAIESLRITQNTE